MAIEEKMDSEVKCTIGDYIRLLQAQEEFDREMPRDIEVKWVDTLKEKTKAGNKILATLVSERISQIYRAIQGLLGIDRIWQKRGTLSRSH